MNLLSNKRVLFIGPEFYNYHRYIIDSLEKKGASVTFLADKTPSICYAIATKISYRLQKFTGQIFLKYQLKKIKNKKFDYIFFIRGALFDEDAILFIKSVNPHAKFIMYQWDSIKNYPHYLSISNYFDKKFSFDKNDCQKYKNLQYLPTFYPDLIDDFFNKLTSKQKEKKIDLLFIGSDHGDRYEILKDFKKICDGNGLICKFYLHTKFRWWLRKKLTNKIYKQSNLSEFIFRFLSYEQVLDLIVQSKIIIDINSSNQQGMTLRTYEALALNSKLLTTNYSILEEKFFSADRIRIFDRKAPSFDLDFLRESTSDLNISSHSLSNWIDQIFSCSTIVQKKEKNEKK